jgi:hypothetical protein
MSRINALLPQTTQDIIATPASVNVVSFDNKDQVKFFIQNVPYNVPSDLSGAVDVFHQYGYAQWVITAQLPMLPPGIQGVAGSMGLVGAPGQNGKSGPPGARGPWGGTIIQ